MGTSDIRQSPGTASRAGRTVTVIRLCSVRCFKEVLQVAQVNVLLAKTKFDETGFLYVCQVLLYGVAGGMNGRRTDVADREEIIKAYMEWDPTVETSSELAARLGISRQRLYAVLREEGISPKVLQPGRRSRKATAKPVIDSDLMEAMAEMALGWLLNQLMEARQELARYRELYGPLPD